MLDNSSNTPNKHYPKDGIITTNSTTIAINNSSGVCSGGGVSGTVTVHQHPSLPRKSKLQEQFHTDPDSSITSSTSSAVHPARHISKPSAAPVIMLNSGRMSAEPHLSIPRPSDYRHNPAINALDLENLDLRNIDPVLASKLLDEIRCGGDVRPLLEKLKRPMLSAELRGSEAGSSTSGSLGRSATRAEKMVTFEDDLKSIATATNASATATLSATSTTSNLGTATTIQSSTANLKLNDDDVFM